MILHITYIQPGKAFTYYGTIENGVRKNYMVRNPIVGRLRYLGNGSYIIDEIHQ